MKKSKVLIFLISVFMLCSCGNTIEELSSNANPQQKNDNNDGSDSSDTQDPQDTEPGNEQNTTKQWIVSYSSAHGTIPPAFIVDEGYILRQSDLPLLSVAGYIFDGWCIEDTKVIPDTYAVMQSVVVSAKWLTGNPTYKVRHYCKSLTQDNILVDEETLDGPSGTRTNAQPKDYYGFHPSTFSQSTINANNTTVVGIYYYRDTYTIKLDLDGGLGTDFISGLYESTVSCDNPSKPDCIFVGWNVPGGTLPETFTRNETYTALWANQGSGLGLYITQDVNSTISITASIQDDALYISAEEGLYSYTWKIDQLAPDGISEIINNEQPNILIISDYAARTKGVYCVSVTANKNGLEYSGRIYVKKE